MLTGKEMYKPGRGTFEYATDLMEHIESEQCVSCVYRCDRDDYPMCFEIEGKIFTETPVPELDDLGNLGVACRKYREGEPLEPEDENQLTLEL